MDLPYDLFGDEITELWMSLILSVNIKTTSTTISKKYSFDRFGDDLAELLLSYLPIEDKWRLQSVSKQWSSLIFNRQTDLLFNDKLLSTIVGLESANNDNNSKIIKSKSVKLFAVIVQKCPNIRQVVIIGDKQLFGQLVDQLVKHCPGLKHISLQSVHDHRRPDIDCSLNRFYTVFGSQLKSLKFKVGRQLQPSIVNTIVTLCLPQLCSLDITDEHDLPIDICVIVVGSGANVRTGGSSNLCKQLLPPSLQSLSFRLLYNTETRPMFATFAAIGGNRLTAIDMDLTLTSDLMDSFIIAVSTKFKELRRLRLRLVVDNLEQFVGQLIAHQFADRCRQLSRLAIQSAYSQITIQTFGQLMDQFGKNLKHLKRLSIGCRVLADSSDTTQVLTSDLLKHMKQLTHLSLNIRFSVFGDQFFRDISLNLPRLRFVDIDYANITRESLQSLSRLKHLNAVRLADCRNDAIADHQIIIDDLIQPQPMVTNVYISFIKCNYKFIRGNLFNNNNNNNI